MEESKGEKCESETYEEDQEMSGVVEKAEERAEASTQVE